MADADGPTACLPQSWNLLGHTTSYTCSSLILPRWVPKRLFAKREVDYGTGTTVP